jgi:hypothetical protein
MSTWLWKRSDEKFFSSVPSHPTCHPLSALLKSAMNDQPIHSHPEDGNSSFHQNGG